MGMWVLCGNLVRWGLCYLSVLFISGSQTRSAGMVKQKILSWSLGDLTTPGKSSLYCDSVGQGSVLRPSGQPDRGLHYLLAIFISGSQTRSAGMVNPKILSCSAGDQRKYSSIQILGKKRNLRYINNRNLPTCCQTTICCVHIH